MNKVLDQTGDINGQQTYRLLTLYETPQFVKEASSEDLLGNDLSVADYADPIKRRFPCHTKAATLLSALFLWDNSHHLSSVDAVTIDKQIEKKASFYGIANDLAKLKKSYTKRASVDQHKDLPDSCFALVIKMPNGTIERHYPLRNAAEVKSASVHLKTYQDIIPLSERQIMAQRILDKAAEFGAGLGNLEEFTNKQAGYGVCSADDAASLIMERVSLLKMHNKYPDIRSQLEKVAEACLSKPANVRSRDSLTKLAAIIDNLDRISGLVTEYGTRLRRPEDVLFGVTEKLANEFLDSCCSTVSGSMYKVADLSSLDLDDLRNVFGDDFAKSVSVAGLYVCPEKMAEQLAVLPRPDAQIVERLLSKAGIKPFAKEAADSKSEWQDRQKLRRLSRTSD